MSRKIASTALFWLGTYLVLILAPLLVLLFSPVPAKGGFWWDAAIACGFAGLAMMVMQFFLTARLRKVSAPFGIDVIFYFHRFLAYALCVVVLLHPLLLLLVDPSLWRKLPDWRLQSGVLALLMLLVVMLASVWRQRLQLAYQHWRQLHLLCSMAAVTLALAHLHAVGYYSAAPWVRLLWWSMALALLVLVVYVHLLRPWLLLRKPWTVSAVHAEAGNCWTLVLRPEGHAGLQFMPGQFAWLSLGHAPFSMQEHPFSLACAPRADGSVEFTIKELGDFTRTLGAVQPGTRAWVDGPYGVFSCDRYPAAPGYVFFGGGIGIAPIFSMLQALALRGDKRPHLLFAAHSRFDRIPRRDELVQLALQLDLRTVPVLETAPAAWSGETGWIRPELLERHLGTGYQQHEFFLCGPKPMTDLVERCLRELGIPAARIHTELFAMA